MFNRVTKMIFIATVASVALAAVASASASTDTTQYRECFIDGETNNTICYTIHSVEHEASSQSGTAASGSSGTMLIEYFDPAGNLIWNDQTKWHSNTIEKAGEIQVYHNQSRVKYYDDGETCTNGTNSNYANGELRHLGPEWEWDCK
jgi:hypothetical protein